MIKNTMQLELIKESNLRCSFINLLISENQAIGIYQAENFMKKHPCEIFYKILEIVKKYNNIETIITENNSKYDFPENYLELFNAAKINFKIFIDKININEIVINKSVKDINKLSHYLIHSIEMNEKRVQNTLKKFHNNYKNE